MSLLFCDSSINQPLDGWDTSNVTTMSGMFLHATAFNQPLDGWDTSNVTTMSRMFFQATAFNQPLNFDTRNVTTMSQMFCYAGAFNQLLNFDTRNVNDMNLMFNGAMSFNQPLNFDIGNMTLMAGMFSDAPFMRARYPRGLGGERPILVHPVVPPRVRWFELQRKWAGEWERIKLDVPERAARIQRKHDSRVAQIRDGDTQAGICVACLVKPSTFVFEKCKHPSACESCVGDYLQHGMDGVFFKCMLCRNPHRVDQIKSLMQWLSENLEYEDELRLSG